jgi:hypothetical protein
MGAVERIARKAWDRQAGETSQAFRAFVTYRDLGPERSLTKVARHLHETSTRRGGSVESIRTQLARVLETAVRVERLTLGLGTDLSKTITHVPVAQVRRLVYSIVEAALPFIADDQQASALSAIEDVCRGGRAACDGGRRLPVHRARLLREGQQG